MSNAAEGGNPTRRSWLFRKGRDHYCASHNKRYRETDANSRLRPDNATTSPACMAGSAIEVPAGIARNFADWFDLQFGGGDFGYQDRAIFIQSFPGHYGLAGYVISIQASPVAGTVLLTLCGDQQGEAVFSQGLRRVRYASSNSPRAKEVDRWEGLMELLAELRLPQKAGGDFDRNPSTGL